MKIKKLAIQNIILLTSVWTIINICFNLFGIFLTKLMNPVPQDLIVSVFHELVKPILIQSLIFLLITTLSYHFYKNKKRSIYGFLAFQFLVFHFIFILHLKFSPIPFFVSSFANIGLQYLTYNGQYFVDVLYNFVPINGDFDTNMFLPLNIGKFYFHWIFLVLLYYFGTTWLAITSIHKFSKTKIY